MGSYHALRIPEDLEAWHTSSDVPHTYGVRRVCSRELGPNAGLTARGPAGRSTKWHV